MISVVRAGWRGNPPNGVVRASDRGEIWYNEINMEKWQIWGRAGMGLGILVAVGFAVSFIGNSGPIARRERGALLALFEVTASGLAEEKPYFTLTNYNTAEKIYIAGFILGAPGLSGFKPYFEGTAVEDGGNKLSYSTSTGVEEAEYILDFPVPIDKQGRNNEQTFVFSFSSSTLAALEGKDVTVSRVLYRKSYKMTSKVYEYDINLRLAVGD